MYHYLSAIFFIILHNFLLVLTMTYKAFLCNINSKNQDNIMIPHINNQELRKNNKINLNKICNDERI